MNSIKKLCNVERDRVTAAEICVDEMLTIMDRHGEHGALYSTLRTISRQLHHELRDAEGIDVRYDRLIRVRKVLTDAFPMTDEDLEAGPVTSRHQHTPEGS